MATNFAVVNKDYYHRTSGGNMTSPFNPLNVEITLNDVQSILTKYGLPGTVFNMGLYRRAFVHQSYTTGAYSSDTLCNMAECPPNCIPLKSKSNERLEFIGDGVLDCITKTYLYKRFSKENEGFMTEKKIAIVKNESIGKIALEMGLHRWLLISQYAEEKNVRVNLVKLGCLFEAFLGALFLDFNKMPVADTGRLFENVFLIGTGFQMAHLFIEHVFAGHIDWTRLIQTDDNYKNILQVKIQKEFKVTPYYMEIVHDGVKTTEHGFRMGVYLCLNQSSYLKSHADATHVRNYGATPAEILEKLHQYFVSGAGLFVFLGEGTHKIKRKAEQQACFQALQRISTEPIYNT